MASGADDRSVGHARIGIGRKRLIPAVLPVPWAAFRRMIILGEPIDVRKKTSGDNQSYASIHQEATGLG